MDVAMNESKKSTLFYSLCALPLICLITTGIFSYKTLMSHFAVADIKYGVNLCFTRVTQSVVALQNQDYFSKHLERSYLDFTNECFYEFKDKVESSFKQSADASKLVENLVEEAVNFQKSTMSLLNKRQAEIQRKDIQSQVLPSYSKLDFARFNLNQWIKAKESSDIFSSFPLLSFGLCVLLAGFLCAFFMTKILEAKKVLQKIDETSLPYENEDKINLTQVEYVMTDALRRAELYGLERLFKKYISHKSDELLLTTVTLQEEKTYEGFKIPEEQIHTESWESLQTSHQLESNLVSQTMNSISKIPAHNTVADVPPIFIASNDTHQLVEVATSTSLLQVPVELFNSIQNRWRRDQKPHIQWETDVESAAFLYKGDVEHYEQLFYCLLQKIEKQYIDFSVSPSARIIKFQHRYDSVAGQVHLMMTASGALFHIDDLEYFFDTDSLTADGQNVMIREVVKELYAQIQFKNVIGESINDKKMQILLTLPAQDKELIMSTTGEEKKTNRLTTLIRGKKKDLFSPRSGKEITI
jgi:hypothetical protein